MSSASNLCGLIRVAWWKCANSEFSLRVLKHWGFLFEDLSISIRATWLSSVPFETLIKLPKVRSFSDFENAWHHWPFSTFNMVYADINGNIGWKLVGDVPIRKNGNGIILSRETTPKQWI